MRGRRALLPLAVVLSALSELAGMLPYLLIWLIVKELLAGGSLQAGSSAVTLAFWAAGIAVSGILLYFAALMCSHLAAFRVETNIRKQAMSRIVRMPLGFFCSTTSGRIRKVIDDNAGITHSFLAHQLPDLAGTVLVPVVAVGFIVWADWRLGLACLAPVAAAMGIMAWTMNTRGREFMTAYMTLLEQMNTEAVEYVRGIPVVKVFQQTVFSFKNLYNTIMEYNRTAANYVSLWERPMTFYTVIINSFVFFLVPLAIIMMMFESADYVILNLILFMLVTPVFSQCVMKSMYIGQAFGQADEAVSRLEALADHPQLPEAAQPEPLKGFDVEFKDVVFAYPDTERNVLNGISFTIRQGQRVAVVGASGGGKTTIARLVPRFYDVKSGSVSIGGTDVRNIAAMELMRNVAFVFQNPALFKTTILDNIRYSRPSATMQEVQNAVRAAQCTDIISRLPQGLNTKIGTEGTYLSGGERQRIALAKAILKDAPVVVLDEATAFADPENEHFMQLALKELTRGKTVLMIAHRLGSVADADQILVVDGGRIIERGIHDELLRARAHYYNRWNEYCQAVNWTIRKD